MATSLIHRLKRQQREQRERPEQVRARRAQEVKSEFLRRAPPRVQDPARVAVTLYGSYLVHALFLFVLCCTWPRLLLRVMGVEETAYSVLAARLAGVAQLPGGALAWVLAVAVQQQVYTCRVFDDLNSNMARVQAIEIGLLLVAYVINAVQSHVTSSSYALITVGLAIWKAAAYWMMQYFASPVFEDVARGKGGKKTAGNGSAAYASPNTPAGSGGDALDGKSAASILPEGAAGVAYAPRGGGISGFTKAAFMLLLLLWVLVETSIVEMCVFEVAEGYSPNMTTTFNALLENSL